jgi:hypothetical protein
MASWAAVPALSGFQYRGSEGEVTFAPRINQDDFTTFWSGGGAWGVYRQELTATPRKMTLIVNSGSLLLSAIALGSLSESTDPPSAFIDEKRLPIRATQSDTGLVIHFARVLRLGAGRVLSIVSYR